jgi:hypothetical protein
MIGWYKKIINWRGCGRKRSWPNLRAYSDICLEGLRKTTKCLSQNSLYPCRDLNLGHPEYESRMLTTFFLQLFLSFFFLQLFLSFFLYLVISLFSFLLLLFFCFPVALITYRTTQHRTKTNVHAGFELTIPATKRPTHTPQTARPPWPEPPGSEVRLFPGGRVMRE